jgi:DNA-binding NtrC family response regulator
MSVLVVDDDAAVRELLRESISAKRRCRAAASAEEALAIFRREKFEVVVAEANLPGVSGAEMIWRMRALDPDARVVVVAREPFDSRRQWGALDVFAYLQKPLDAGEVARYVELAIASR